MLVTLVLCLCLSDYATLTVLFLYNGVQQRLSLKLPLTVNKFFEPTDMNSESFFGRWKNLSGSVRRPVDDFFRARRRRLSFTANKFRIVYGRHSQRKKKECQVQ